MLRGAAIRRAVAMVLLLIVGPTTSAAAACAGWSSSAAERMACCLAAAGHCAAISPDDCCADAEERQNLESTSATAVAPPEGVSATPVVRPPLHRPSAAVHQTAPGRPDTYLLDSVFLI